MEFAILTQHRPSRAAWRPTLSVEALILAACLYFGAASNGAFWHVLAAGLQLHRAHDLLVAAGAFLAITSLHFLLLAPWVGRRTVKPVLTLLLLVAAIAAHFMAQFGVHLDTSMLRNVAQTDMAESRELLSWGLAYHVALFAVLPAILLWTVRVPSRRRWQAGAARPDCRASPWGSTPTSRVMRQPTSPCCW